MSDRQRLDDHSLTRLQGTLTASFDSVKGQLHRLNATIDNLEGQWQGIGAGAFNTKQAEVNQSIVRIGKLLLKFQEGIEAARTIGGNTEDEILQAMRGVDVVDGYQGDARAEANTSNLNKF